MLIEYGNTTARPEWYLEETSATGFSRIYYILSGRIHYRDSNSSLDLEPGRVYVLPSAIPYRAMRERTPEFICTYMHISFEEAQVNALIELDPNKDECLKNYILTIRSAIDQNGHRLLDRLADSFSCFLQDHHAYIPSTPMQKTVLQYVREHLSENIVIEELSHLLSYHPNYFIRLYKQETGYTPYQYILQQRMQYAVVLLNKGKSNQEICEACGYTDSSTFTRAFRQYYGVTPQKYRMGLRKP